MIGETTIRVSKTTRQEVAELTERLSDLLPVGVRWTQAAVIQELVHRFGDDLVRAHTVEKEEKDGD